MSTSSVRRWLKRLVTIPALLLLAVVAYFGIGAVIVHQIDDDPTFAADVPTPDGGLRTLAAMAALLEREIDRNAWVANDPAFLPGSLLPSMAAYQIAIRDGIERMAQDLQAGRSNADLDADPDLETALGSLAMPGDIWAFDLAVSWRPQRTSEAFYRDAVAALRRFNARVAAGNAAAGLEPLTVRAILARADEEFNLAAETALAHVERRGGHWLDRESGPLFARAKGDLDAQFVLLRALGEDVAAVGNAAGWGEFLASLERAATLQPAWVMNGRADSLLRPAHLAVQAGLILRAQRDLALVRRALAAIDA